MSDLLNDLTPDESLRADNEIKLLKLQLEHDVIFSDFDAAMPPEQVGEFLDSIFALEEMHKNPTQITVYDKVGQPTFQPESSLTDNELLMALDGLLRRMGEHSVNLDVLAPDDYDDRTIYRFLTEELFPHETTDMGGGWTTNFIYEEFHPNHPYDISNHCHDFINMLVAGHFDSLSPNMADHFFDREAEPWSHNARPIVTARLTELLEGWWPRTPRSGTVENIQVAHDAETAQATLVFQLGVAGNANTITQTGTAHLSNTNDWWSIDHVTINGWELV